ncbi:uncharacterized protein LOC126622789 [Malus sylvestris]|uniref:uncharacterized protein LOC126622789 n=1 Tax=Malus sylvestris TaxID=3752 RepID=UPI0021AC2EAD|nr:uncharacterized protein LOC126622789 [Malus sylvestris]
MASEQFALDDLLVLYSAVNNACYIAVNSALLQCHEQCVTTVSDTGAIDHVTSDSRVFDELCDYVRDPYVTSVNGAHSPMKGEDTISLTPTLSLVRALLVTDLKCNLLSRSKLDACALWCVFIGSDMPSELPVSMSDELPSNDRLPAADISNELPDDGSSSDDSSNSLVQDGGIHKLPPRANRGKPKVQYEPDMHAKAKYPINNYVSTHRLSKPYASYISNQDWPLLQFDVKNVFLHGDLKEEVYMDLPPGIGTSPGKGVSHSNHTLFLKRQNGKLTALIIYVDDMIVTGDDQKEIQRLQKYLATEVEMKELGEFKYFLGIEVARSKHNQVPTHKERYQRLAGRLIYLSHTRPDIAYAVSVVSQFMYLPSEAHMDAVTRILRYLKMAPGRCLFFSKNGHLNVEGYTDADWAGSITNRRSTSGYFTMLHGEEKFMHQMKNDVLHQIDRPFFPLIRQILKGSTPSGGPNPFTP